MLLHIERCWETSKNILQMYLRFHGISIAPIGFLSSDKCRGYLLWQIELLVLSKADISIFLSFGFSNWQPRLNYHHYHQHLHYLPHHNHHDLQHDLHHQEELPTWIPLCLRWRSSPCSATPAGWPVAGRGDRAEWRGCRPAPPCQPPWRRRGLKVANY